LPWLILIPAIVAVVAGALSLYFFVLRRRRSPEPVSTGSVAKTAKPPANNSNSKKKPNRDR